MATPNSDGDNMARILVLGTDPPETEVLALTLEFVGYRCATQSSLQEALAFLKAEPCDAIVLHSRFSSGHPDQIVRSLKSISQQLPVILLSESDESVNAADHTLQLPCSPEDLFSCIEQILNRVTGCADNSRMGDAHRTHSLGRKPPSREVIRRRVRKHA